MKKGIVALNVEDNDMEIAKNGIRGVLKKLDIDHVSAVIMTTQAAKVFWRFIMENNLSDQFHEFYKENIPKEDRCLDLFSVIDNRMDKFGQELYERHQQ